MLMATMVITVAATTWWGPIATTLQSGSARGIHFKGIHNDLQNKWRKKDSEKSSHSSQVTQLVVAELRTEHSATWLQACALPPIVSLLRFWMSGKETGREGDIYLW